MKLNALINYLWDQNELVEILDDFEYDFDVENAKSLADAGETDLTFCSATTIEEAVSRLEFTKSRVVLINANLIDDIDPQDKCLLPVRNARLSYIRIVNSEFMDIKSAKISDSAIISKSATIYDGVGIGEHVVIGERVHIGKNTIIHHGVAINERVRIGKNCIIYPNTVIGWDGFGYEYDEEFQPIQFPHRGSVIIGDNVHIGSNTSIDRGTINDTIIGDNVKIDNLCHIAHNVIIGHSSIIIALSLIAGSVKIGHHSWVAPSVTVRNGINVGDRSMMGMGAVVVKDVRDDTTVVGVPAKELSDHKGTVPKGFGNEPVD